MIESMVAFNKNERPKCAFGDPKIHATSRVHNNSVAGGKSILDSNRLQILFDAIGPRRMIELGYAGTVEALKQKGIVQRDASVPMGYQQMVRHYRLAREADINAKLDPRFGIPATRKTAKQRLTESAQRFSLRNSLLLRSVENRDLARMGGLPAQQNVGSPACAGDRITRP